MHDHPVPYHPVVSHRTARRAPLAGLIALLFLSIGPMVPGAQAHTADGTPSSNYHSTVRTIEPPADGFRLQVIEATNRIEVEWLGGPELVIIGSLEEDYLRVGPDGVFENLESPSTYLNADRQQTTLPPSEVDTENPARRTPRWRQVSGHPIHRWHEHRVHWMGAQPPSEVRANPDAPFVIDDRWILRIRRGSTTHLATGSLEWIPGPDPTPWRLAAGATVVFALAAAIAALLVPRWRRRLPFVIAPALIALVVADAVHLWVTVAGVRGTPGEALGRAMSVGFVSIAAWGIAAAALLGMARRIGDAVFLVVLAAAIMTVVGGVADHGTLGYSNLATAGPAWLSRAVVAATLGLGAALLLLGIAASVPHLPPRTQEMASSGET